MDHDGGVIRVQFAVNPDEVTLEISDSGKGDAGQLTRADPGPGVGRTLMTAFARQLRGRTEFRTGPDGGVSVLLAFPAPEGMGEPPQGGNRLAS